MYKILKKIYIIFFVFIICIPIFTIPLFITETKAEYAKYTRSMPMTVESIYNKSIETTLSNFEEYVNQHLSKRQSVISLWSTILYNIGVSANDNIVIGKDGMLYYYGTLHSKRVIYGLNDERIKKQIDNIQLVKDICTKRGIEFVFIMAPDKETIYPEYVPDWYTTTGRINPRESFSIKYNELDYDFNYLDLSIPLLEAKKVYGDLLYPNTDAHWTMLGSYASYYYLFDNISTKYQIPQMYDYTKENRDSYEMIRMLGMYEDKVPDFETNISYDKQGDYIKTYLTDKKTWKSYYSLTNDNAFNDASVLVIRDSYTTLLADYFAYTFKESRFIHYEESLLDSNSQTYLMRLLDEYSPDLIVLEVVERAMPVMEKIELE